MQQCNGIPERLACVLFVESESDGPRRETTLREQRHTRLFAADGRAALNLLRHREIDVMVVDEGLPDMAAPFLIAAASELSPCTVAIIRTLGKERGVVASDGMLRLIPRSSPDAELQAEIDCVLEEIRKKSITSTAEEVDPQEALADAILSQDLPPHLAARSNEPFDDFSRTMTEQELAATDVIDAEALEHTAPVVGIRQRSSSSLDASTGVLVFSPDPDVVRCVTEAAAQQTPLHLASNVVQATKILKAHCPEVLLTDVAEDRYTISTMVRSFRTYTPQLIAVALSTRNDPAEMAWLINNGFIFRFLKKPLSVGRCSVCLDAALRHALTLKTKAEGDVGAEPARDAGTMSGVYETLKSVKALLA